MRVAILALLLAMPLLPLPAAAEERTTHFTFTTAPGREPMARELAESAERVFGEVAGTLGLLGDGLDGRLAALVHQPIHVRVLHGDEAFGEALGHSSVTDWAAGVASPKASLILLKIDQNTRFSVHDVFRHEVSHVLISRAVLHRPLAQWFVEGVAVHQAGERILDRWRRVANATLGGDLVPLALLEDHWPDEGLRADLAYAEATSFLTFLLQRAGWGAIRRLLVLVREGQSFRSAFRATYGHDVEALETEWREAVERSSSWLSLFVDSNLVWALMVLLFLWAYLAVRRRNRLRLERMPDDRPDVDDEFA